jgi:DNA mismatch repair protein MutL
VGAAPIQISAMAAMAPPVYAAPPRATPPVPAAQASFDLDPAAAAAAAAAAAPPPPSLDPGPATWAERMRAQLAARAADRPGAPLPSLPSTPSVHPEQALAEGERASKGEPDVAPAGYFARLRYLGQLDRTFLVCEGDGELVLIDQHVAHERVELQRLRERAQAADPSVQRLLFPTTIEVAPEQLDAAAAAAPMLAAVGFEVEPFGGTHLAVKAVPAGLRQADPAVVLRELLDGLDAAASHHDDLLATIACHSVVRAGDLLGEHEARALLLAMDGVDFRQPGRRADGHGNRPVLLRLGVAELARRFGR